jgi:hypothetical protein
MSNVTPLFAVHPSPMDRVVALARTFPSLEGRSVESLEDLYRVADDQQSGTGSKWAALFCLSVCGRDGRMFCHRAAWGSWDDKHRAAWQAWAAKPWWV